MFCLVTVFSAIMPVCVLVCCAVWEHLNRHLARYHPSLLTKKMLSHPVQTPTFVICSSVVVATCPDLYSYRFSASHAAELDAIDAVQKKTFTGFNLAYKNQDYQMLVETFTEDCTFVPPGSGPIKGRDGEIYCI